MKRKTLWHRLQTERAIDKLVAKTGCRGAVILGDEFDKPRRSVSALSAIRTW